MNDTAYSYDNPSRDCDLIMKGGVTSGLVYPQAVLELARNSKDRLGYRFCSIGGASAGAVAAVLAAAAEHNRPAGGFRNLEAVNTELQSNAGGISFLQSLFQAKASMQPLLDIVLRLDDFGKIAKDKRLGSAILAALRDSRIPGRWTAATIGALIGVIVAAVFAAPLAFAGYWGWFTAVGLVLAVLCALIGGAAGWLYRSLATILRLLTVEVPRNYFGICSGMNEAPAKTHAVMEWLHESTQKIAGQTEVLTFGQLKAKRDVTLELMTTNVSENRPYAFPFDEPFIFCRADFAKLFPNVIVEAMTKAGKQRNASQFPGVTLPEDYFFFPRPDDLPIVVAARMSMSFPLFFSSIPLYALPLAQRERVESDRAVGYAPAATDLIPHWFSDGGICSNFPIHFFDAWLPRRPTFGITLRYLPGFLRPTGLSTEEKHAAQHYRDSVGAVDDSEARPLGRRLNAMLKKRATPRDEPLVVLPKPTDSVPPEWSYISTPRVDKPGLDSVPNFLWAVMSSMQNYRDDSQAALPSYRERVVQIRLNPDEGGFNLDMGPEKIQKVVGKGQLAGEKLDKEFVNEHHRWVRLLVLTSELERVFRAIREKKTDEEFARLIDQQCCTEGYPYREKDQQLCEALGARLTALSVAMNAWASKPKWEWRSLEGGTLPSVMRVTPKI